VVDKNNVVKSRNIAIAGRMPDLYVLKAAFQKTDKILLEGVQKVKDDDKIEYEFQEPKEVYFKPAIKSRIVIQLKKYSMFNKFIQGRSCR
jgi:hypothetical protein